jgi:hypothetical protein
MPGQVRYTHESVSRRTDLIMEGLIRSLSQSSGEILLATVILLALALFLSVRNHLNLKRHRLQWRGLLDGVRGDNLERLLMDSLRDNMALQEGLQSAVDRIVELEKRMEKAKSHLGLVRYDAFDDVGGNQSFALALYDDNGDGMVINGLVGRTDCRVYCKPLVGGRSDRNLSQEERRAIEEALSRAPKSVVTR